MPIDPLEGRLELQEQAANDIDGDPITIIENSDEWSTWREDLGVRSSIDYILLLSKVKEKWRLASNQYDKLVCLELVMPCNQNKNQLHVLVGINLLANTMIAVMQLVRETAVVMQEFTQSG
ncbi:hypothetical protein F0562_002647 [Nyssa sinensis]|uniref:Uncharacterized protein n=1 Tax=Nyssa sinensis TaxID=561372 RepID=A0A5J5BVF9_9ASTE|nr:hypothetical protein F0562_002647 [Nyssa sinensis]